MLLLGFDPGGIKSFGWAVLYVGEADSVVSLKTGVASNAPEAVRKAGQCAPAAPAGVGIDAPLFWVQEGDRRADSHIRKRVVAAGGQSGTVSSVNSLRGACLVQGILAADFRCCFLASSHRHGSSSQGAIAPRQGRGALRGYTPIATLRRTCAMLRLLRLPRGLLSLPAHPGATSSWQRLRLSSQAARQ